MKRLLALLVILAALAACAPDGSDNENSGNSGGSASLKFNNESGVPLVDVVWNGIPFGSIPTGEFAEKTVVTGGSGSIHFTIDGSNANLRTQQSVLSTDVSFTFRNTTLVLDATAPAGTQADQLITVYNSVFSVLPTVSDIITSLSEYLDNARVTIYMLDGEDKLHSLPANSMLRNTVVAITVEHANEISSANRDTVIALVRDLFAVAGFNNVTVNVSMITMQTLPTYAEIISGLSSMGGGGYVTEVSITHYTVNDVTVIADSEGSFPANAEIKITVFFRSQMFGKMAIEDEVKRLFDMANFDNVVVTATPR